MHTVLDFTKLFLFLVVGLLYFLGLGWLLMELVLAKDSPLSHKTVPLLQKIPLALTLGLITNYGISLVFQSVPTGLTIGALIAMIGVWRFGIQNYQAFAGAVKHPRILGKWIAAAFLVMIFLSPILIEPLQAWDSRAIWFFHAKMIYFAGTFGDAAGWQIPTQIYSHTDYPNLVPGIAAQVTYLLGYWNEYIPKISLVYILVPIVLWLFTFAKRSFTFVILLLLLPFCIGLWLWNGYMDGYFALYLSTAVLLFGRYVQQVESTDIVSGLICLAMLPYLKNEGMLAWVAGFFAVAITVFLVGKDDRRELRRFLLNWRMLAASIIVLVPFIVWNVYKRTHGLENDLQIGNSQGFLRLLGHINDRSYGLVIQSTYQQLEVPLRLLSLLFLAVILWRQSIPRMAFPAFVCGAAFYLGIFAIYLMTPNDFVWQINTSVDRTMLSVSGCIFVGCYFILDSLEMRMRTEPAKLAA